MKLIAHSNIRERVAHIQASLRALPQHIEDMAQETVRASEGDILDIVGFEPPAPRFAYGDFPWESERQKRYVLGFILKGQKYQRQGNKPRGWKVLVAALARGARIRIVNEDPRAKYLHGTFTTQRPQQRFHHIIGWPQISAHRRRLYDILLDALRRALQRRIKG